MSLIRTHSDERLAEEGLLTLTDEKLERAFREIEEASERRAQEEEKREAFVQDVDGHPAPLPCTPTANGVNGSSPAPTSASVAAAKKRHRGSISISRVGTFPDLSSAVDGTASPVAWTAPAPLPVASAPASSNAMYRVQTRAASVSTIATISTLSSFSRSHGAGSHNHDEELNHTTQKQTIIGRRNTLTRVGAHFAGAVQAVSNLADAVSEKVSAIGKTGSIAASGANELRRSRPRTMTRTLSKQALRAAVEYDAMVSREDPVVIGVQVQEKMTEEKRASAESADGQQVGGASAGSSSKPTIATVIHASKSESEIGQVGQPSSSNVKKKGRPRTATGSGDALPPPPQSFATVSAGASSGILQSTSTTVVVSGASTNTNANGGLSVNIRQERRTSQNLDPTTGVNTFRKTASKRLSILRTGFPAPSSPSGSPAPASGSVPLSPSSTSPLPSPRRSPNTSPSRSPSFPSLAPSTSPSPPSSSAAVPPIPPMCEQTTTIEVGTNPACATSANGGDYSRSSRPALKRSITHYARVLAKKLRRRTVSAAPTNGVGGSVSSTASGAAGVPGVTTSTTVVEEKQASPRFDGDADMDVRTRGEPSTYPIDIQEIEIRVEGDEGERNVERAMAVPLPPSPSPIFVRTFEDVIGSAESDERTREAENREKTEQLKPEDEREIADSAIEVRDEPRRIGQPIVDFSLSAKDSEEPKDEVVVVPSSFATTKDVRAITATEDDDEQVVRPAPEGSSAPFLPEFGIQENRKERDDEHESEVDETPSYESTVDEPIVTQKDTLAHANGTNVEKDETDSAEPTTNESEPKVLSLTPAGGPKKNADLSTSTTAVDVVAASSS